MSAMVKGQPSATVDIVTVTFNSSTHLDSYLAGLARIEYPGELLRLIVVDNASMDGTAERLNETLSRLPFPAKVLRNARNAGFGMACNQGAAASAAEFLLFLNPDAALAPDALARLVERARADERVGLVDAAHEPIGIPKWADPASGDTDWCSGAALLARRAAYREVGGFDPFFFLYAEDVDLSWRAWLGGWRCVHEARARVHHVRATADGGSKPIEVRYTVRYSFPMRLIYDTWGGFLRHLVRGARYLVSPRTSGLVRSAVARGLCTTAAGLPHLLSRRRWAQARMRARPASRYVFTEWYYGRWIDPPPPERG